MMLRCYDYNNIEDILSYHAVLIAYRVYRTKKPNHFSY